MGIGIGIGHGWPLTEGPGRRGRGCARLGGVWQGCEYEISTNGV